MRPRSRPYRRVLLLIGVAVAAPSPTLAQVNIEALRQDDPPLGRSGSFTGNLTISTGNVDFIQLGLNGRHYVVDSTATTLFVGNGGIGLVGRSRFASSGLLHLRRTYAWHDWVSPEWYLQMNYDRSQNLAFRVVAGSGIRTAVAEGEWGQFGAGAALMLEHERLDLPDTALHPRETNALRLSSFLTTKLTPTETLVITSTTYVQPEIGAFSDLRILENFRLAATVTERVSITISFDLRYDSDPPDAIARLDSTLRTGITYAY